MPRCNNAAVAEGCKPLRGLLGILDGSGGRGRTQCEIGRRSAARRSLASLPSKLPSVACCDRHPVLNPGELTADALKESRLANGFTSVGDGEELLDYLHQRGDHAHLAGTPQTSLILIDRNMPRWMAERRSNRSRRTPSCERVRWLS